MLSGDGVRTRAEVAELHLWDVEIDVRGDVRGVSVLAESSLPCCSMSSSVSVEDDAEESHDVHVGDRCTPDSPLLKEDGAAVGVDSDAKLASSSGAGLGNEACAKDCSYP
mmetsp:Transcript_147334/g.410428  ORF Transcript_147334/g.410428 Transcript_147334/m.410428 type:complete len:110 (-) Transcript_147334:164-493(-)